VWNSLKSLPQIGVDVLVYSPSLDLYAIASLQSDDGTLYWQSDSDILAASPLAIVTHWMPLPDRPDSVD
jgi:hypothetical protein